MIGLRLSDLHKTIGSYAGYFEQMAQRKVMWTNTRNGGLITYKHINYDILLECDLTDGDNIAIKITGDGGVRYTTHKYTESRSNPVPDDTSIQVSYRVGKRCKEVDYATYSVYVPALGSTRYVNSYLDIDTTIGDLKVIEDTHKKSGVFDDTTGQLCDWSTLDTHIMCV